MKMFNWRWWERQIYGPVLFSYGFIYLPKPKHNLGLINSDVRKMIPLKKTQSVTLGSVCHNSVWASFPFQLYINITVQTANAKCEILSVYIYYKSN